MFRLGWWAVHRQPYVSGWEEGKKFKHAGIILLHHVQDNFYVVTSVHTTDPLNNPDKIVTMFYMNDKKLHKQIMKVLDDSKWSQVFK